MTKLYKLYINGRFKTIGTRTYISEVITYHLTKFTTQYAGDYVFTVEEVR